MLFVLYDLVIRQKKRVLLVLHWLIFIVQPIVNFDFGLGLTIAIALLQDPDEFFGFAVQSSEIIIREFAPALPPLTLQFMPLSK
jgi:hypothetical protein